MRITHSDALYIEAIARKVHNCDRFGMAGIIDADHFENNPFDATIISLAPIWKNIPENILEKFVNKWWIFRNDVTELNIAEYKKELSDIVNKYFQT